MMIIPALLKLSDFTVFVEISKSHLVINISLEGRIVIDNVVKRIKQRDDCFKVFPCVAISLAILNRVGRSLGWASQVVENLLTDLVKWRKAVLKINRVVLHPVGLKKLHKAD